jgi:hypothetical protein
LHSCSPELLSALPHLAKIWLHIQAKVTLPLEHFPLPRAEVVPIHVMWQQFLECADGFLPHQGRTTLQVLLLMCHEKKEKILLVRGLGVCSSDCWALLVPFHLWLGKGSLAERQALWLCLTQWWVDASTSTPLQGRACHISRALSLTLKTLRY